MKTVIIFLISWVSVTAYAQDRGFITPKGTESRIALVIGNSNYSVSPLKNPVNDARAMRNTLKELGFTVQYYENLGVMGMEEALLKFSNALKSNSVGLFYFAGHGFEGKDKTNYLMSTDMPIGVNEALAKSKSLNLDVVIGSMQDANTKSNILIVDACRNNPFRSWSRNGEQGLGKIDTKLGTIVFFASSTGQAADDNTGGQNGLFTEELINQIKQPNTELSEILKRTSRAVYKRSGVQMPAITGNLLDDFYFLPPNNNSLSVVPTKEEKNVIVKETPKTMPTLINGVSTKKFMDLPFAEMVYVQGGTFEMGDTRNEGDVDEKPVHSVTVSDFWMGKYEVTQAQWESIMGLNPSYFKDCPTCPVEQVSWDDVQEFLKRLNAKTGSNYRLPTEAEWEYAAGGGNSSNRRRFGNGEDILRASEANFDGRSDYKRDYSEAGEYRNKTTVAGSLRHPNGLGIHDMVGNVLEWCSDWYGTYASSSSINPTGASNGAGRVLRGGSWYFSPQYCRVAYRINRTPSYRYSYVGFRVVSP